MVGTIIGLLIVGLLVGLAARAVLPGKQDIPIWLTVLIGVGGLLIGGAVFGTGTDHRIIRFIVGVVIAVVLLIVVDRAGVGRRRTHV